MKQTTYCIAGRLIHKHDRQGMPNFRIEAWDKDHIQDDCLGITVTDPKGNFKIVFTEKKFHDFYGDLYPDLYFKVYDQDKCVLSTESWVIWNIKSPVTLVLIEIDIPRLIDSNEDQTLAVKIVKGQVVHNNGNPESGIFVRAFDKGVGVEKKLGESVTGKDGFYRIEYTNANLSEPHKGNADLIVRAYSSAKSGTPSVSTPLILNALPEEIINLVVGKGEYRGLSEYQSISQKADEALSQYGIDTISEKDCIVLANKIHIAPNRLSIYIQAKQFERETQLSSEVFFGLLSFKRAANLPHLLSQDRQILEKMLNNAIKRNIIGISSDTVESICDQLGDLRVEEEMLDRLPDSFSMKQVLSCAEFSEDQQKLFLSSFYKNRLPMNEFWNNLKNEQFIGPQKTEKLQLCIQLGAVTMNHGPMIKTLLSRDDIQAVRDLARFSEDDWKSMIEDCPDIITGKTRTEKKSNYAKTICQIVEDAFPTGVFTQRMIRKNVFQNEDLKTFFSHNQNFEFKKDRVKPWIQKHPEAMEQISNPLECERELCAVERLFKLAPRYNKFDVIYPLFQNNLHSAHAVAMKGKTGFVRSMASQLGGEAIATQVFFKANTITNAALCVLAKYSRKFDNISTYVVEPARYSVSDEGSPDQETLFGSLDFCECEHCRSVLSPAAYLVDLLHFLENTEGKDGRSGLTLFLERRPDIGEINLSCENTNIPVSYIDLVNEVLESCISPDAQVPQTAGDAKALKAGPEHLNTEAYQSLIYNEEGPDGITAYPWNLPFNLWAEEARIFCKHLGVQRHQIMEVLHSDPGSDLNQKKIATEYLGFIPQEYQLIVTPQTNAQKLKKLWGIKSGHWNQLRQVSLFLKHARLNYDELLELLKTKFVNHDHRIQITCSAEYPCSPSHSTINIELHDLDIIHRFIRLKRKLNWSFLDLDRVISAVGDHRIDEDLIVRCAKLNRLRETFNLPLVEMLGWWSLIDTTIYQGEPCFYDQLFLNITVNNPIDEIESVFRLNETRNELATTTRSITDPEASELVLAAVNLTMNELIMIIDSGELSDGVDADGSSIPHVLNLSNLSYLYRIGSFARAFRISVSDYLTLKKLMNHDPLSTSSMDASPEDTLQFMKNVLLIRQCGISIEMLDYLLTHHASPINDVQPSEQSIGLILSEIKTELNKIVSDIQSSDEDLREKVSKQVGTIFENEATIREFCTIIDGSSEQSEEEQQSFIEHAFSGILNTVSLIEHLVTPGTLGENINDRFSYIAGELSEYLIPKLQEKFVQKKLVESMDIDSRIMEKLLKIYVRNPDNPVETAMDIFLDETFVLGEISEIIRDNYRNPFRIFERLYKISVVINALRIDAEDIDIVLYLPADRGWIDLTGLPMEPVGDLSEISVSFQAFLRLIETCELNHTLFKGNLSLFRLLKLVDLFESFSGEPLDEVAYIETQLIELLHVSSGWDDAEIQHRAETDGVILSWSDTMERAGQLRRFFVLKWLNLNTPMSINDLIQFADQVDFDLTLSDFAGSLDDFLEHLLMRLLSDQTGWQIEDIEFLASDEGYGYQYPEDFKNGIWFAQLSKAFEIIYRIGSGASKIWSWHADEAGPNMAREIRNAVKSKYQYETWLEIVAPLRDTLREKQRDALQAYVVYHKDFEDVEALFSYYLIDTQMSSCAMTSRIKLAISSVQLFVQRILMNLEEEQIEFVRDEAEEWKWRKHYRVWEANRKIFLYPENWIEPELRHDKTPFFQELEDELLQDDITKESAERIYLNYLKKLDEVSRLEISGLYQDEDKQVSYVFARTTGIPHVYYFRKWVDKFLWTPWEKIHLDIESDHLVPIMYNRRLYLFWPVFIKKADEPSEEDLSYTENGDGSTTYKPTKAREYYEIYLGWSQYKNGKWTAQKRSVEYVRTLSAPTLPDMKFFYFWGSIDNENNLNFYLYWNSMPLKGFQFNGCSEEPVIVPFGIREPVHMPLPANPFFMKLGRNIRSPLDMYLKWVDMPWPDPVDGMNAYLQDNTILTNCSVSGFKICVPHQYRTFLCQAPFFFEDRIRTFFVIPELVKSNVTDILGEIFWGKDELAPESIWRLRDIYSMQPIIDVFLNARDQILPDADNSESYDNIARNPYFISNDSNNRVIDRTYMNRVETSASQPLYMTTNWSNSVYLLNEYNRNLEVRPNVLSNSNGLLIASGSVLDNLNQTEQTDKYDKKFRFQTFYHPYSRLFVKQLNHYGIQGLLDPVDNGDGVELLRQLTPGSDFKFKDTYHPTNLVLKKYPIESIDFEPDSAMGCYNWEVFFHAPFLIANRLMQNQQFEEAQKWFHFIFNPTEVSGRVPSRFWKIKPFYQYNDITTVQDMIRLINEGDPRFIKQIEQWEKNPFDPHQIAQFRHVAYMKAIVMKYIDNLIAWGDHCFRRDSIESINEATQLYILAAQILDRKPTLVESQNIKTETFNELHAHLDLLSNAGAELESEIFVDDIDGSGERSGSARILDSILYFCIPKNEKLLTYWDTVADRLFKIRHCMNIEGVRRELPLFEPPIEPGLLVQAAAAGVDISSALNELSASLPYYRFNFMIQKALELCQDVRVLGSSLMMVLEKKDAEKLSLMRTEYEVEMLENMKQIREKRIEEARALLASIEKSKEMINERISQYENKEYMNSQEALHISKLESAKDEYSNAMASEFVAAFLSLLPDFVIGIAGVGGTPNVTSVWGMKNLLSANHAVTRIFSLFASIDQNEASQAYAMGSFDRRQEEWDLQIALAQKEIEQIDRQIAAAEIRLAVVQTELENHEKQTECIKEIEDFIKTKFTNKELYNWMVTQISTIYFQAYQMAYDLAKRAEKTFRYELAVKDTNYIKFGYWDSLKKGLLSGEQLYKDLKRMELAYIEQNKREYEITKHVSLASINPHALIRFREEGSCEFVVPEVLFDLDFPGQYLRRIKSVRLTIPCITGPYTNINCKLTLVKSRIRISASLNETEPIYGYTGIDDERFTHQIVGSQSIATTHAQNDSGLFELNFRDERYLPFEGTGAISTWKLELSDDFKQFDYRSISDIVMHISYTARDGSDSFKTAVKEHTKAQLNAFIESLSGSDSTLIRYFSLKHEFSNALQQLLRSDGGTQETRLQISQKTHFPYMLHDQSLQLQNVILFIVPKSGSSYDPGELQIQLRGIPGPDDVILEWTTYEDLGGLNAVTYPITEPVDGEWPIAVTAGTLDPNLIQDMGLLFNYRIL